MTHTCYTPLKRLTLATAAVLALAGGCATAPAIQRSEIRTTADVAIWSGAPVGTFSVATPETRKIDTTQWRPITLITDVSNPSVTVIRPAGQAGPRPAMIILPGGAFGVLAWDVEGTEVGEFLAARGITAFVLKYRVRTPTQELFAVAAKDGLGAAMEPGREAAAQDAMQAVRFVREHAAEYGVDPNRVGMVGFSAGGITTLRVLQNAPEAARPNIAAPVYAPFMDRDARPEQTPLFIAVAQDDPSVEDSKAVQARWQAAGAPVELHIFPTGGHGFGLGRPRTDSMAFSGLFEAWLRQQGYIAVR